MSAFFQINSNKIDMDQIIAGHRDNVLDAILSHDFGFERFVQLISVF